MSGTPILSKVALAIACALATLNAPLACTAVDIVAADKSVIAGRTMEWAFDMQWTLISQPKGTPIALTAPPGAQAARENGRDEILGGRHKRQHHSRRRACSRGRIRPASA